MATCFRCGKRGNFYYHHIDGRGRRLPVEEQNNNKTNLIPLCPSCHDMVEGICSKCVHQSTCNIKKFKECWRFEDALPPINFKSVEDELFEQSEIGTSFNSNCPKCGSNKIKRISLWRYGSVYSGIPKWTAIYECNKCKYKFKRTMMSLLEQSIDIEKIPIEIKIGSFSW